jgi:putative Mn2+ efflux pump MntP
MREFEIFLSAASLAMDAFAASMGIGACLPVTAKVVGPAFRMAAACGAFQFFMPLGGAFLGSRFLALIADYDHWVAFSLLAIVGVNMIRESRSSDATVCPSKDRTTGIALLTLALATSIDALAVGISFTALGASVMTLAVEAGVVTSFLCAAGVVLGFRAASGVSGAIGERAGSCVELLGGVVLCCIGLNILRVHLCA